MNQRDDRRSFQTLVFWYHSLPAFTTLVLLATFFLVWFATNSTYLAVLAAFVPSSFMLWRWAWAGYQVDRWRCAKCGQPVKNIKKMLWTYPPSDCPHCGIPYVYSGIAT